MQIRYIVLLSISHLLLFNTFAAKGDGEAKDVESCIQWDTWLSNKFGGYSAPFTTVARGFCTAYTPAAFKNDTCKACENEMTDLGYFKCIARLAKDAYNDGGNNCKEISCMVEFCGEKRAGWECTQVAHRPLLGMGHVITRCDGPNGEQLDLDPQSGKGQIIVRTSNCGNIGVAANNNREAMNFFATLFSEDPFAIKPPGTGTDTSPISITPTQTSPDNTLISITPSPTLTSPMPSSTGPTNTYPTYDQATTISPIDMTPKTLTPPTIINSYDTY